VTNQVRVKQKSQWHERFLTPGRVLIPFESFRGKKKKAIVII